MSGKFGTTSSNLFNNNNKNNVPDWMQNLADDLKIKDHHIDLEMDQPRGAFASAQSVFRPEADASLRPVTQQYNKTKLITDAKIQLAKFLTGKYFKVKDAHAGLDTVSLEVVLDGVPTVFQFPYEVKNSKLVSVASFYGNDGEYPFSKPGLQECLIDIKKNKTQAPKIVEAVNKTFMINREEVVRRYNGSLREATDRINSLLNEGIIIGAGSNSYASYYDLDHLFPQMEKQATEERMAEFHFAPNQEHIATNEFKPANVLAIEASKVISQHFADFVIKQSSRDDGQLLVNATILNSSNNIRSEVNFAFEIENEKVTSIKTASVGSKIMSLDEFVQDLNSSSKLLNQYASQNQKGSKRIYEASIFKISDVKEKLGKIVSASKIDRIIDTWVAKQLVTPLSSTSFSTNISFEDLLSKTVVASFLSNEEVAQIEAYQQHFGQGLDFERDEKAVLERVREASDAEYSDQTRLAQLQSSLSKTFKNFTISDFEKLTNDSYKANLNFLQDGTRNKINITASFDNGVDVFALINDQKLTVDKLSQAFQKSLVLTAYLNTNKSSIVAGKTVMSDESIRRKLSGIIGSNDVNNVVEAWLNDNLLVNIGENNYVSEHSFEELLQMTNIASISDSELADRTARQARDRGMEVSSAHIDDTGERQVQETWSAERMVTHASQKIGTIFKEFSLTNHKLDQDSYTVIATIVNPQDGLSKQLSFKFAADEGVVRELVSISDGNTEVTPSKIASILDSSDEAVKQFVESVKSTDRSYKSIVSRNNLEVQLRSVVSSENMNSAIDSLIEAKLIQPINSHEFASEKPITEFVAYLSQKSKTNVEAGKKVANLASRNEHKVDLRGHHVQDTDNRVLENKDVELSPQMKSVQAKLKQSVTLAEKAKKITANKSSILQNQLELATTEKDIDLVSKELKRYL